MKTNTRRTLFSGQSSADTQASADAYRLVWQPLPEWKHLQGEALDDAVAQAKRAIISNSLQLASLCEDAHEWQTALMSYDLVLALDASHVLAHLGRGAVLMQQGKWDQSIASFMTAARLEPADALPYIYMGQVFDKAGQEDASVQAWAEAKRRDPGMTRMSRAMIARFAR